MADLESMIKAKQDELRGQRAQAWWETSFREYSGMSYEQANLEAERLIKSKGWFQSFERLVVLREIMKRQGS